MPVAHVKSFDTLAEEYDARWSDTAVGVHQRRAVWNSIDSLFRKDDLVLDLGCGTGVDALHLESLGVYVFGIDSSCRMVEVARRRGVDAYCQPIENLERLNLQVDGVISNFGALNCVKSLSSVAPTIARMLHPGGYVAACLLGRTCLWEIAHYLRRGQVTKAVRRLSGKATSSLQVDVFYPSRREVVSAFGPDFRLVRWTGVGLFVPPSYVGNLSDTTIARLAGLDRRLAHLPLLRSLADHSLYVFQRL
jgi:SAM-dependent methyltransferase